MSDRLHVEGSWPGRLSFRRGWSRATARPWNDDGGVALRLLRGSSEFLRGVALYMNEMEPGKVYSPALYRGPARTWRRAGFTARAELGIMERALAVPVPPPPYQVLEPSQPNWTEIVDLDAAAFSGWWRMGRHGLTEATAATTRSAVLTVHSDRSLAGYALVGAQYDVCFLQRVAVHPDDRGRGVGMSLVRHALHWGRGAGTRVMVLNVRPDNEPARALYRREGFDDTDNSLTVLGFGG